MNRLASGLACLSILVGCGPNDAIVVGSKNFTESVLLGEIVAQQLERYGLQVDRRLNLGGSFVCHSAITAGQLDIYVEYTGTAYSAILKLPKERDPKLVRHVVDSTYAERWGLEWVAPLGFNNTFALLIRDSDAQRLNIATISDLVRIAPNWRFGAGYEFIERVDGYRGLLDFYGLSFDGQPREMDLGLTYRALADRQVDIIAGNSTDGQIESLDLFAVADDRGYFPPYEAAPVVRKDALERYPIATEALAGLAGVLDEIEMRRLNYLVDVEKRHVKDVATQFLKQVEGPESKPTGSR